MTDDVLAMVDEWGPEEVAPGWSWRAPTCRSRLQHERSWRGWGVAAVPDLIANGGGIVAAAHSTDRRRSPFTVDADAAFQMISDKLRANAVAVLHEARRTEDTPSEAARRLAQQRVREAVRLRRELPDETLEVVA